VAVRISVVGELFYVIGNRPTCPELSQSAHVGKAETWCLHFSS